MMALFSNYLPEKGDVSLTQAGKIEETQEALQDYYLDQTNNFFNYVVFQNDKVLNEDSVCDLLMDLDNSDLVRDLVNEIAALIKIDKQTLLAGFIDGQENDKFNQACDDLESEFFNDNIELTDLTPVFEKYHMDAFDLLNGDREDLAEYLYDNY